MTVNELMQHEKKLARIVSIIGFDFLENRYDNGKALYESLPGFVQNVICEKDKHYLFRFSQPFRLNKLYRTVTIIENN